MTFIDPAVEQYILDHTTREDEFLVELAEETARVAGRSASMQISADQGRFLTTITQLVDPYVAVEVGTFTGYSSICIARGLGRGHLHCYDVSEEWTAIARRYWEHAGVTDKIELTVGPALETLRDLKGPVGLAFIDADKGNYPGYYELLMERMDTGGVILADNTLWSGRVADPANSDPATEEIRQFNDLVMNDPRVTSVILPIRDGVTLIRKR
ncbi:O-methyltransferase [Nonomuraea sp. NPDC050310]|uniref:O-methyltransferase n=1 Tax=unclassified Nonomuraea TaxID=2593643 RepID=UPI0033E6CAB6